jgi:lipopolysaccharide export system protein LptA
MNVSANGGASTVTFKSVQVIINKLRGNQNVEIYNQTKATGITATTGTATQIYVFNDAAQVQAALTDIQPGDVITAEVITTTTDSGAATRQVGMLPWFPYYGSTNNKSLSQSAILLQGELV